MSNTDHPILDGKLVEDGQVLIFGLKEIEVSHPIFREWYIWVCETPEKVNYALSIYGENSYFRKISKEMTIEDFRRLLIQKRRQLLEISERDDDGFFRIQINNNHLEIFKENNTSYDENLSNICNVLKTYFLKENKPIFIDTIFYSTQIKIDDIRRILNELHGRGVIQPWREKAGFWYENISGWLDKLDNIIEKSLNRGNVRMNYVMKNKKVFIVHGHDDNAKNEVARFIQKLGLQEIILHEQKNRGMSIAEKLEANSDVQAAVVLLSADDKARKRRSKKEYDRARQNVILELGYFWGKLDRKNVFAINVGKVEIPSDIHGILYIPYDKDGAWKISLFRELQDIWPDIVFPKG